MGARASKGCFALDGQTDVIVPKGVSQVHSTTIEVKNPGSDPVDEESEDSTDVDSDVVEFDVLAWQRKHCNDGYFDKSDAKDILTFLDPQTLHELASSVETSTIGNPSHTDINWKRGEKLGKGAFGTVVLGFNAENGTLFAAKQIPIPQNSQLMHNMIMNMEREIKLMSRLRHDNIVQYLGSQRDSYISSDGSKEDFLSIFMEYIPGGSIATVLKKFGKFNETILRIYAKEILTGMAYLHAHGVVHRDIKGGNILVDRSGVCKLSDFGASTSLADIESMATSEHGPKSLRGTPSFMAPEVIKQIGYGRKSDIWSFGCTMIEMLTGKPPWSQFENPLAAMYAIAVSSEPPQLPADISPEAADLIRLCLQRDPRDRPTAAELLRHPFVVTQTPISRPPSAIISHPKQVQEPVDTDSSVDVSGPVDAQETNQDDTKRTRNPFGRKQASSGYHSRTGSAPEALQASATATAVLPASPSERGGGEPPEFAPALSMPVIAADKDAASSPLSVESPLEALARTIYLSRSKKLPASGLSSRTSTMASGAVVKSDADPLPGSQATIQAIVFDDEIDAAAIEERSGTAAGTRGIHTKRKTESEHRGSLQSVPEVTRPGLWTTRRGRILPHETLPAGAETTAEPIQQRSASWGEHMYKTHLAESLPSPSSSVTSWWARLFKKQTRNNAPVPPSPKPLPPPIAQPARKTIHVRKRTSPRKQEPMSMSTLLSLAEVRSVVEDNLHATFARINASDTEMGKTYSEMYLSGGVRLQARPLDAAMLMRGAVDVAAETASSKSSATRPQQTASARASVVDDPARSFITSIVVSTPPSPAADQKRVLSSAGAVDISPANTTATPPEDAATHRAPGTGAPFTPPQIAAKLQVLKERTRTATMENALKSPTDKSDATVIMSSSRRNASLGVRPLVGSSS